MLKVVLQQKFPHLSPGSESEKGPQAQQNRRGAYQGCLRGRSRFPIRNACCRPTYRPEDCHKSSACRHFFHQRRATIRQRLNLRAAIVLRQDTHAPHLAPPGPLPYSVGPRACTPILTSLTSTAIPVAEPISSAPSEDANGRHAANIGKDLRRNLARARPTAQPATITALPYSRAGHWRIIEKTIPRARGPAEKQSGDK